MTNTIKDIYYGNILPCEESYHEKQESRNKAEKILWIRSQILSKFPDAEELLENYQSAHYDSADYYSCQQFQLGMRLGAQLMMELMTPVKQQE